MVKVFYGYRVCTIGMFKVEARPQRSRKIKVLFRSCDTRFLTHFGHIIAIMVLSMLSDTISIGHSEGQVMVRSQKVKV